MINTTADAQTASVAIPEIAVTVAEEAAAPSASSASEKHTSREEMLSVPVTRPAEILEEAPGLIITQHSGEGKANQYFLRGFNLDHGTDLAISVDGMPVNMPSHGHGQGYADVNFLIPELVRSVRIRKGPYCADEGDFSSAGAISIDYFDRLDKNLALLTLGSFGYRRGLVAASTRAGDGTMLVATEAHTYNGPWDVPDNLRKFNGVMRYSQGTLQNGFSVTGMAYHNKWTATDQVADRAVESGLIGRFGTLDPTDGGSASRYSLSTRWRRSDQDSRSRVDAYLINSSLWLYSNFTYFLDDPVNGDQFRQNDQRTLGGVNASHTILSRFGAFDSETKFGIQTRYDDISVGLNNTVSRSFLSGVRNDKVQQGSLGVYAEHLVRWNSWFRTVAGLRGDRFQGRVASDTPENSGSAGAFIASPKLSLIFGPFTGTEFFLNLGRGFHSNDLRGATITVDPVDKTTPLDRVPLLVRTQGGEIGMRTQAIANLDSTVALFILDNASELLFIGDAGTTEPSRPSRRIGIEWTNHYKPLPWLTLEGDLAVTHARFTDEDPAGNFIPGAPNMIASAGVTFGEQLGWFGTLKLRYFGPRPLVEDDSVRSGSTALVNARLGYHFANGVRVQLDALNLFNTKADQISYYYTSRLQGEPPDGVAGIHSHPVEPLAFRVTLAAAF